jgi:hypothetical protein
MASPANPVHAATTMTLSINLTISWHMPTTSTTPLDPHVPLLHCIFSLNSLFFAYLPFIPFHHLALGLLPLPGAA